MPVGKVATTVVSQQEGLGFLCKVCMVSLCMHGHSGFPPRSKNILGELISPS